MTEEHVPWMQVCLELGRQALRNGNPPVGSVIVRAGHIIGRGQEAGKSRGDITFHAEIEAIRQAVLHIANARLDKCVLYTTHEPCLMCSYVIRHHRVSQVIMGLTVPYIGGYSSAYPILKAANIPIWGPPPLIISGICQEACEQLSAEYRNQS
jgi:tRNA(adenine34) deaminase